jgi:hypothetical protein
MSEFQIFGLNSPTFRSRLPLRTKVQLSNGAICKLFYSRWFVCTWCINWMRKGEIMSSSLSVYSIPPRTLNSILVWRFLVSSRGGVRLSPLGTSATTGLLHQRMADDERGTVGVGMGIGRGNRSTRRNPTPLPLCPPQMQHDLTWARTRAPAVGSRPLTAWAMARLLTILRHLHRLRSVRWYDDWDCEFGKIWKELALACFEIWCYRVVLCFFFFHSTVCR